MKRTRLLVGIALAGLSLLAGTVASAPKEGGKPVPAEKPRVILGRIEYVVVRDVGLKLKARIDTGAGVSSIHAKILGVTKTPDGERVKFQIVDDQTVSEIMERPVVGWSKIKMMGTGQKNRRPIVELRICLGGKKLKGRVNLNDRSEFLYPVLVGRNLLTTGKFLVDASEKFLVDPGCE